MALAGLFLDWAVLRWLFRRDLQSFVAGQRKQLPELQVGAFWKPAVVMLAVIIGFLAGVPPALASALGAAALLISRTTDSHKLYGEVDWGLLVFFIGLFLIVGGAENAGIVSQFLLAGRYVNLHSPAVFTVATAALSNLVSNVPAVMLLKSFVPSFPESAQRLAPAGYGVDAGRKSHDYGQRSQHHRGRNCQARHAHRLSSILSCRTPHHNRDSVSGMGLVAVGWVIPDRPIARSSNHPMK